MEWSLSAGGGRLFLARNCVLACNSCWWLKAALVCRKFLLFWVNAMIGSSESLGRLRQRTNYYVTPICSLNSFFFSFCFLADHSVHWTLNECTEWSAKKKEGKKFVQSAEWSSCGLACVSGSFKPSWLGSQTWPGFGQVQENPNPPAFPSPTTWPVTSSGWLRNVLFFLFFLRADMQYNAWNFKKL